MTETRARARIVAALNRAGLHAFAVENACHVGTPDINSAVGWIEVKWRDRMPARASTPLKPKEPLKPEQRIFLEDRTAAGESCYVLLQVEREQEWFLLDGPTAAAHLGTATREQLARLAIAHWHGREMERMIADTLRP